MRAARGRSGTATLPAAGAPGPPYAHADDLLLLPIVPRAQRTFRAVWRTANPRRLPIAELVALVRSGTPVLETT